MNPQDCVWEIRYQIIMKTILQEKETALQIGSQFYFYASIYENSCSKSSGGQKEKLRKISAWNLTKVRSEKWSMKQGRRALQFILQH